MDDMINTIQHGDCIAGLEKLGPGQVDLAFADPPFNIGYDYDVYDDRLGYEKYLDWSRQWISVVYRALKPDGAFWLAIGDEFAAELKLESQKIGFHTRSWVVWYYTFGVNCTRKFTRSHAHLFYFVKDPKNFTFRESDLANRIPSARQLVYNDNRANPNGRLPDDTWIIRPTATNGHSPDSGPHSTDGGTWTLRPQDLADCFGAEEDTWYFPRVAGTFKERAGFHGCQMPEQLLGRIIRTCSNEGDLVVDPFSGSATTVAVAKKLGRRYLAFDISADYVRLGCQRLDSIEVGDRLDGSPEPLVSAPATKSPRAKQKQPKSKAVRKTKAARNGRGLF
jgi:site-specific DNA-methyltransferase (adenine-specific)